MGQRGGRLAQGVRHYNEGRFAEAEAEFALAAAQDGSAPDARILKAFCRQALGDDSGARREMERTLKRFPSSAAARVQFGQLCVQQGRFDRSLALAREALRLDPKSVRARELETTALAKLSAPGTSALDHRAVRRAKPRGAAAWYEKSLAHVQRQEWRDALRCARSALRLEPGSARASKLEVVALTNLGRPDEVLTALRRAQRAAPEDVELWVRAARVHADLGRNRKARAALLQASKLGLTEELLSGAVASIIDKAGALRDSGRFSRADKFMDLALEYRPRDPDLWFKQGILLRHHRRLAQADSAYKKACDLKPERLEPYLYRAEALMARGLVGDVLRVLRRGRDLCPMPKREDYEGWLQRYRLSASLFDFASAARIGEIVLNGDRRLRHIEGLCWPILVDDFELVRRPSDFLRRAESALDRLPKNGKVGVWGRFLRIGFSLQPGSSESSRARALAESAPLARLPRARYGWMRYVTGCLRKNLGHDEAALADFRASSRAARPANWLALLHENEILLSQGRRAEALRGLRRIEPLVPQNRGSDFLLRKGWFMLEAGRLADARRAFERAAGGARAPDAERGLRAVSARGA